MMLADVLARNGCKVALFERRNGLARKLFIAGSSGLNISHDLSHDAFVQHYTPAGLFEHPLRAFTVKDWLSFIENLGLKTFLGTSRRYFIEPMNALPLVRAWKKRLSEAGVEFLVDYDCVGFERLGCNTTGVTLSFADAEQKVFDAVAFCLGGASYEEVPPPWPAMFRRMAIEVTDFRASNVGFRVQWPQALLKEAEGKPLKDVVLATERGVRRGDMIVTTYGLEGTPIYFVGIEGEGTLDLKPALSMDAMMERLRDVGENLSPMRRVQQKLKLSEASLALLYHLTPSEIRNDLQSLVLRIKNFPVSLIGPQPLAEAISTKGGIALSEIDDAFMLKKIPGVFAAGEMLDWDAPTGGFLIQGCVSQGVAAAHGVLEYLTER